jgi:cysteine synthase A
MGATPTYLEEALMPRLLRAQENLLLAQFDIMKLIPANYILTQALSRGALQPGGTVVEISSGTFALALAIVAKAHGLNLKIVTISIDACLEWRLRSLGAEVHIVRDPDESGSIQQTQLRLLERIMNEHPDSYWTAQYRNTDNPASYRDLARYLTNSLGQFDVLVGTVGTGGSMSGTSAVLREHMPHLQTVGVDSNYSVTFFGCDDRATADCKYFMDNLLGLGSRLEIPVIDHTVSIGAES